MTASHLETQFVGLRNYSSLLSSARFLNSIANTLLLALYSLVSIPFGFLLAVMLQSLGSSRTQPLFRVILYLPNVITGVSIILIFRYVLMQDGGLLNTFLSRIAGCPVKIGWLIDQRVSKFAATIIAAWSGIGYCMLICLAGLQSISSTIYEAAAIDGANAWQKLRYITIPCMMHTFVFLLITRMISGLRRFNDLYMLGGVTGLPAYSLQTILMYVYQYSFAATSPNYGLSSAAAMIFFAIVLAATLVNLRIARLDRNS